MGYKIIIDGKIVDALTLPVFVRYNPKAKMFITCRESDAQGVASHDWTTYWSFIDRGFGLDDYPSAIIQEITDDEAQLIIDTLDDGKDLLDFEDEEDKSVCHEEDVEDVEFVRQHLIERMSKDCEEAIVSGIDWVDSNDAVVHFSYTLEDQMNLLSLSYNIEKFGDAIPYHADGCNYRCYSKAEFEEIIDLLNKNRFDHCLYFNCLRRFISDINSLSELISVYYGMEIPDAYKSDGIEWPSLYR